MPIRKGRLHYICGYKYEGDKTKFQGCGKKFERFGREQYCTDCFYKRLNRNRNDIVRHSRHIHNIHSKRFLYVKK